MAGRNTTLGHDVLGLAEFEFTPNPKDRKSTSSSNEALQSLMQSVKKQIAFFEETTTG
jgi:hypothetical protein